jgi:hypothetical protein
MCIGSRQQRHGQKWRGRPPGLGRAAGSLPRLCQYLVLAGPRTPAETLQNIFDLLGWIERAAVLSPGSVDYAAAWAQDNEAQAARTFAEAIELREALFGIFSAIGTAEACDQCDFVIFGATLAAYRGRKTSGLDRNLRFESSSLQGRDAMGAGGEEMAPSIAASKQLMECPMPQPNDLSRSLVALDQNSTIIAVVEMSQSSWLVGGISSRH